MCLFCLCLKKFNLFIVWKKMTDENAFCGNIFVSPWKSDLTDFWMILAKLLTLWWFVWVILWNKNLQHNGEMNIFSHWRWFLGNNRRHISAVVWRLSIRVHQSLLFSSSVSAFAVSAHPERKEQKHTRYELFWSLQQFFFLYKYNLQRKQTLSGAGVVQKLSKVHSRWKGETLTLKPCWTVAVHLFPRVQ